MSKAVDPFEEFLRKKKVEQLQQKILQEGEAEPAKDEEPRAADVDDPAVAERVKEEMQEFFEEGGSAGAELFSKVGTGLSVDKVEEIRDAVEDVFEAPPSRPAPAKPNEAFVDFFKNVQDSFVPGETPPAAEEPPTEEAPAVATLALEPDPPPRPDPERQARSLDLAEILSAPTDPEQLAQRVDLLCRLLAKLVERAEIPESEIIEVLIKSGVEF